MNSNTSELFMQFCRFCLAGSTVYEVPKLQYSSNITFDHIITFENSSTCNLHQYYDKNGGKLIMLIVHLQCNGGFQILELHKLLSSKCTNVKKMNERRQEKDTARKWDVSRLM